MNVLIFVVKTDLTLNLYQIILPNTEMLISWGRGLTSWWSWQRTIIPCPPSTSSDTPPHCLSTNHRLWSRVTSKCTVTGQCSVTRNKKKPTIQCEKQEGASSTLFLYLILTMAYLNCSVLERWFIDFCFLMLFKVPESCTVTSFCWWIFHEVCKKFMVTWLSWTNHWEFCKHDIGKFAVSLCW